MEDHLTDGAVVFPIRFIELEPAFRGDDAAFAARFQGHITRSGSDFRNILPTIALIEP